MTTCTMGNDKYGEGMRKASDGEAKVKEENDAGDEGEHGGRGMDALNCMGMNVQELGEERRINSTFIHAPHQ